MLLGGGVTLSSAQEAVRASLAGEAAAAARRRANMTVGYYNVMVSDLRMRFRAGLELEANDNVNLSAQQPRSDLIVRPQAGVNLVYPITERNSLNLNVGGGYSHYFREEQLSRYFITPGSELSFDIFVGDCVINLHDRFSVTQDSYANPATTGSGDVGTFDNTAGVSTTWDLNKLLITAGYDYTLRRSTTSGFSQQDADSHGVFGQLGFKPNPSAVVGVETGVSWIDRETFSGGVQYHGGVFYRAQVTEYISAQAGLGYTRYDLDRPVLAGGEDQLSAMYGNLLVRHRANRWLSHALEGGREVQIGLFSSLLDLYYVRWQANWSLVQKLTLGTYLSYEWGTESGGANDELTRYGGGVSLSRGITKKLTARLYLDHLVRESNLPGRDYTQNRGGVTLNYGF